MPNGEARVVIATINKKAIDNIQMVWEEVTVSCMKGVWHISWPSNKNYGKNCDNMDMLIKEISEIAEEVCSS